MAGRSINDVSWYLCVAFFLYFIFPWVLKALEKIRKPQSVKRALMLVFAGQIVIAAVGGGIGYLQLQGAIYADTDLTKWMDYNHPLVRSFDFIIGCLLGYLFIHKNEIKLPFVEKRSGCAGGKAGVCAAFAAIFSDSIYILFKVAGNADALVRPYRWWTWAVIFIPGTVMLVWIFAENNIWLTRVFDKKFFHFCSRISAEGFLIHFVVIRFIGGAVNKLLRHFSLENLRWGVKIALIPIYFAATAVAVKIWRKEKSKRAA